MSVFSIRTDLRRAFKGVGHLNTLIVLSQYWQKSILISCMIMNIIKN